MILRETCPQGCSRWYKRNGHIHTGKQNHRCKVCGRAFVLTPENSVITEEQRADQYAVYTRVIPPARHRAITKLVRMTNHIERFNCTLRRRVSRLVCVTLSFSKPLLITSGPSHISFAITTSPGVQHYQDSATQIKRYNASHYSYYL